MHVFLTGASGFIGRRLALALANMGYSVHALVRSPSANEYLHHANIRIFLGDILDKDSILEAMKGCDQVYHLAGLAKMWMKDKNEYFYVNVKGTENVLRAACKSPVEKIVITSTAGVFPPTNEEVTNENSARRPELYTEYERTKEAADRLAFAFYRSGVPVTIVNPTKVYGPGPIDDSNTATMMLRDYLLGKWKIIPGNGKGTMNYVYIDDAVAGIISSMQKARPGAQYILGGENASYDEFFALIRQLSGIRRKLYHIPYPVIRSIAWMEDTKTKIFGTRPLITSEWVKKLPFNWSKDASKAMTELDFHPRSLREGLQQTIHWLSGLRFKV